MSLNEHLDTQAHSFECRVVKVDIKIEGSYKDVFEKKIKPELAKTLLDITNLRENYF